MPKSARPPISPHLQVYRPQLTSVLSFAHRVTGLTLGLYSIALVAWLVAAAAGPRPFLAVQRFMQSPFGAVLLFGGTFCFFLHLCGGIRHLVWDSGRGFELGAIYASGCTVVAVSTARGLGSAKNGVRARWLKHVTAVALVPLTLWLTASLIAFRGRDYAAVIEWLRNPLVALLLVLLLLALFVHLALGLKVVIEDYVHSRAKMPALVAARLGCVVLCVTGILATLSVSFGG